MSCTHWQDIGHPSGGMCKHFNKTVSHGVCLSCPHNDGGDKWLAFRRKHRIGDKIASVTSAVGIKPCGGCKRRQAILNGES